MRHIDLSRGLRDFGAANRTKCKVTLPTETIASVLISANMAFTNAAPNDRTAAEYQFADNQLRMRENQSNKAVIIAARAIPKRMASVEERPAIRARIKAHMPIAATTANRPARVVGKLKREALLSSIAFSVTTIHSLTCSPLQHKRILGKSQNPTFFGSVWFDGYGSPRQRTVDTGPTMPPPTQKNSPA